MPRVILFGATGFTGRLTAAACLDRGLAPVLAGRDAEALEKLSADLGGLPTAVADADRPATLRDLTEPGDVLVTTVGPYARYGEAVVAAAVDTGAHYLDLTGEPPFIRRVMDVHGPRAERTGTTLLPAFGHDWVPGNLAAALALRDAGPSARRVEIGYFDFVRGSWFTGVPTSVLTSGTRATLAADTPPHSYRFRGGHVEDERLGRRVRAFTVDGRSMRGISYGGSEQLVLARLAPHVTDVDVWLGWLGQASRLMSLTIAAADAASRVPAVARLQRRRFAKALAVTGQGPDSWPEHGVCTTVAEVYDSSGTRLARADVRGPVDAYRLSADLLAWGADRLATGRVQRAGACGPVDAFGLDVVEPAFAGLGLRRV